MAHPPRPVRLTDLLTRIDGHWSPKIAAEANGWHLKLVKVRGEFVWHAQKSSGNVPRSDGSRPLLFSRAASSLPQTTGPVGRTG